MTISSVPTVDTPAVRSLKPERTLTARLTVVLGLGFLAGVATYLLYQQSFHPQSDWDAAWYGARAWLAGQDPYLAARSAELGYTLLYPGPALLLVLPLAMLPLDLARSVFIGLGAAGMAYALTRQGWWGLLALLAAPVLLNLLVAQWGPLLLLGATVPALGFLLAAKPTIGAALWVRSPTRQAVIGGVLLVAFSLAVDPGWPMAWYRETRTAPWIVPLISRPWGWLLLLAWVRWRDPDARLLGTFALVPFTMAPTEILACFLIPRSFREMAAVVAFANLSYGVVMLELGWPPDHATRNALHWPAFLWLFYLPVTAMVLLRRRA